MKVKLIVSGNMKELEDKINDFLEKKIKVIDIKYSHSSFMANPYISSAMIMYEELI